MYAKFTLKMSKDAHIDLFAGVALAGQVKVEDNDGEGKNFNPDFDHKQEFDPAPILGTRVKFLF